MPKPFDVTTKVLVEMSPADWLTYLGLPGVAAEVIDADLATVTTEADRVLKVTKPDGSVYLLHIEFQASPDDILQRTFRYNVLLCYRHGLPVVSVIMLLRRAAERAGSPLPDIFRVDDPVGGEPMLEFRCHVVRLWEQDPDVLLAGGLAVLPLAPLAKVSRTRLPQVVRRMNERIAAEAPPARVQELRSAAYILMGLQHADEVIEKLMGSVKEMRESTTYQAILAEGRAEGRAEGERRGERRGQTGEARRMLLLFGADRLGAPSVSVRAALDAIDSVKRLEDMARRVSHVASWDELLAN